MPRPKPVEPKLVRENKSHGDKMYTHPSFGMAGFSHVSSTGTNLFGSSLRHQHYITLRIKRAELGRNEHLHNTHVYGREEIIEIAMSEAQFGQLISTFNRGDGIPVTISSVGHELMPEAPPDAMLKSFKGELKQDLRQFVELANKLLVDVRAACEKKGALTKDEKSTLLSEATKIVQELQSSMPFFQEQFEEAMEGVVSQAITEVEAHVQRLVNETGLKALSAMQPAMPALEGPTTVEGEIVDGKSSS